MTIGRPQKGAPVDVQSASSASRCQTYSTISCFDVLDTPEAQSKGSESRSPSPCQDGTADYSTEALKALEDELKLISEQDILEL